MEDEDFQVELASVKLLEVIDSELSRLHDFLSKIKGTSEINYPYDEKYISHTKNIIIEFHRLLKNNASNIFSE